MDHGSDETVPGTLWEGGTVHMAQGTVVEAVWPGFRFAPPPPLAFGRVCVEVALIGGAEGGGATDSTWALTVTSFCEAGGECPFAGQL